MAVVRSISKYVHSGMFDFTLQNGVVGILEAVETLLERGHEPQRSIYLAFGHDEEVMGNNGALIAHLFIF